MIDPDRDIGRQLVQLTLDQCGRHVTGGFGQGSEAASEGALENDGTDAGETACRAPQGLSRTGVTGIHEPPRAVVDDEANRGNGVRHRDRRHPELAHALLGLLDQRPVFQHRGGGVGNPSEVWPHHVVEHRLLQGVHDGLRAGHRHRAPGAAACERLRQEGEPGHVIEVRVADERMLDLELLRNGESAADAAGVDQDTVVDEKGRRTLAQPFASEGAEHSKLHIRSRLALLPVSSHT